MKVRKTVLQKQEKKSFHLFWGERESNRNKYGEVGIIWCIQMEENDLGLRILNEVQMAFSCKLWWKATNGSGMWGEVQMMQTEKKNALYSIWMEYDEETKFME